MGGRPEAVDLRRELLLSAGTGHLSGQRSLAKFDPLRDRPYGNFAAWTRPQHEIIDLLSRCPQPERSK
jgi:hypothetical protein